MGKGKFRRLLATFFSGASFVYITAITFCEVPTKNMDNAKVIMGFLLGTALALILGFYFGDAEDKQD